MRPRITIFDPGCLDVALDLGLVELRGVAAVWVTAHVNQHLNAMPLQNIEEVQEIVIAMAYGEDLSHSTPRLQYADILAP